MSKDKVSQTQATGQSDHPVPLDAATARVLACWVRGTLSCDKPTCPVCGAGANDDDARRSER